MASLVAQMVKKQPTMQEIWVRFLGLEDPLEKEMETHSSICAWRISWTEKPGGLYSQWGCKELDMTEQLTCYIYYITYKYVFLSPKGNPP